MELYHQQIMRDLEEIGKIPKIDKIHTFYYIPTPNLYLVLTY